MVNARSLAKLWTNSKPPILAYDVDLTVIAEMHLKKHRRGAIFAISGYQIMSHVSPLCGEAGGVTVYIRDNVTVAPGHILSTVYNCQRISEEKFYVTEFHSKFLDDLFLVFCT